MNRQRTAEQRYPVRSVSTGCDVSGTVSESSRQLPRGLSQSGLDLRLARVEAWRIPQDNLRFSGESTAFGIGETKAPPTHALLKHAILFLEILNYIQLMAVYPTCEHQEEHLNRLKQ